jgi:glycosyltransferase involved in cell wall biosynthesis
MAFSVIIPAHNEEAVIARCLAVLLEGAPTDHAMEVIVAANGCTDATVAAARAAAPQALVIDLPQPSKTAAINAANAAASHYPRVYLDADVECPFATARALAEALDEPGSMTAAPAIRLDLDGADRLVRAYYRVWLAQPYARSGMGGAGCYALSQAAIEQVGRFPLVIGDDVWIHTRFAPQSKRYVTHDRAGRPVFTVVHPPRHALEQMRVEARRRIGNLEVLRDHASPHNIRPVDTGGLRSALGSGLGLSDVLVHFGIKLAARLLARWSLWRGAGAHWSRDTSSRRGRT